ncbi:hypothetical protein [Clavibacter capsici]|uniref:hypothetical protein n=1 Tax=Clavibacter capsici TaxID=1874630 RepID=UPI0014288962|nr:hypothetical protein [Clavibacter capsici]QIS38635.1 hypothetical protein GW572_04480 [Clavibacter capsici]
MTDSRPFHVTQHALNRALEMGVTGDEINDAYNRPIEVWRSPKYDCQMRHRGRVTLSIDTNQEPPTIVTVLWSTPELWAASYEQGTGNGRNPRQAEQMAHLTRRKGT